MRISNVLPTLLILFAACGANAQFRIFAGPQLTSANYEIHNAKQETSNKTGFIAGVGLTTELEGQIYFAPSLTFSRKGYKVTFNQPSVPPDAAAKNNNTTLNTLEIAPLLQVNFSKQKSHGFFRFGPSFDFALSGREAFDSTGGKHIERAMTFESVAYSVATASGNFQLGYEHRSGFGIYGFYELGLSSLNNNDGGPIILHRIGGIAVGWKF